MQDPSPSRSSPQSLTVAIYSGEPGLGARTLVTKLGASLYHRTDDRKQFAFYPCIGTASTATSMAIVLANVNTHDANIYPTLERARQCAANVCVVYTKIDLVPRDYSQEHVHLLSCPPRISYRLDLDCFAVSSVTGEGLDGLRAHIANTLDPLPNPLPTTVHEKLARLSTAIIDWFASCFALPSRRISSDISAELPPSTTKEDIYRLMESDTCTVWNQELLNRLGAPDAQWASVTRITPSIIAKNVSDSEWAAMEYVRRHTSIPVPRVHYPHLDLFLMDYIDGAMLLECWDSMSRFMQFRVACTLRLYVKQLRMLTRANVGSVDDGWIAGTLFDQNRYPPFESARRFRQFCEYVAFVGWETRVAFARYQGKPLPPLPRPVIDWTLVLNHGDLNLSNIILDREGCLWILDWDSAGFYPACIEPLAMRHVDEVVRPSEIPHTWTSYRSFIAGATTEDEQEFWYNLFSAIHRFPVSSQVASFKEAMAECVV